MKKVFILILVLMFIFSLNCYAQTQTTLTFPQWPQLKYSNYVAYEWCDPNDTGSVSVKILSFPDEGKDFLRVFYRDVDYPNEKSDFFYVSMPDTIPVTVYRYNVHTGWTIEDGMGIFNSDDFGWWNGGVYIRGYASYDVNINNRFMYDGGYGDEFIIGEKQLRSCHIISPASGTYTEKNRPDIIIAFAGDWAVDFDLWKQESDGTWTSISTLERCYIPQYDGIMYALYGDQVPYVPGHLKLTVVETIDMTSDVSGQLITEVEFDYHPTNENIVDILGIEDGKTYEQAPLFTVTKTGTYKDMPVQLYINGEKQRDIAAGMESYEYCWGYDNTQQKYENPYKIGDNVIEVKDTNGTVLKKKKFILTKWKNPNEYMNSDSDSQVILPSDILNEKFPFCVPFDVYNSVKSLKQTGAAPKWTINFDKRYFKGGTSIVIDFAQFELLAKVTRWGILILFVFGLIVSTRKLIGD